MGKRDYLNILFDYYNELLTEKECLTFQSYYDDDFSLGEIASDLQVSRSAVHKSIKVVEDKLNNYENKLKLYEKRCKVIELLEQPTKENLDEIKNII